MCICICSRTSSSGTNSIKKNQVICMNIHSNNIKLLSTVRMIVYTILQTNLNLMVHTYCMACFFKHFECIWTAYVAHHSSWEIYIYIYIYAFVMRDTIFISAQWEQKELFYINAAQSHKHTFIWFRVVRFHCYLCLRLSVQNSAVV